MIQDIFPSKLKNEYNKEIRPSENDTVLNFKNSSLFAHLDKNKQKDLEELIFPKVADVGLDKEYTYLFAINEENYFLCNDIFCEIDNFEYIEIKELRRSGIVPKERVFALYTGKHLMDWYRDNKFCGRCGGMMTHSDTERAMVCKTCGYTSYPRIMPAVIVGVINGEKILLTKYRTGFAHYALIAGFTEIGETVEETVSREVMEEAGLKVKNIRYYKSQPWGIANDILIGFYCDVDGDTEIHMDDTELKFAEWVERDQVILQPNDYSLTNEMMNMFKTGKI